MCAFGSRDHRVAPVPGRDCKCIKLTERALLYQQRRCAEDHEYEKQRGRPAHQPAHGADRNAGERGEGKSLEHAVDHALSCIRSVESGLLNSVSCSFGRLPSELFAAPQRQRREDY